jgi:hypothetical protein
VSIKEQARVERRVTAEQVQQIAFSQGELFRMEAEGMTEAMTGAFLRACLSVRPGERIVLSLRIGVERDEPDEPAHEK